MALSSFSHGRRSRKPALEALETRVLLAGNVTATASPSGELELIGDELGNEVKIWSGGQPGELFVEGENNTRINGTDRRFKFQNVERIFAYFRSGDDSFKSTNLTLSASSIGSLYFDGGAGDDRVEVKNTTILAAEGVQLNIIGESTGAGLEPSSGNDVIELADTTFVANGSFSGYTGISISGDDNSGGVITGGNDRISVTNTSITTTGDFFSSSVISIRGDSNVASSGDSTIGGGNDSISVANTTITNNGRSQNSSALNIEGDFNRNDVFGGTTASSVSRIGGGNDTISVSNTRISGSGAAGDNTKQVFVRGDYNEAFAYSFTGQGAQSTAIIGGGNDSISVTNTVLSAEGPFTNAAFLFVEGEYNSAAAFDFVGTVPAIATATIEGNDSISVGDVEITATGATAFESAVVALIGDTNVGGDDFFGGENRAQVTGGHDRLSLNNAKITAAGGGGDSAIVAMIGDQGAGLAPAAEGDDAIRMSNVRVEGDFAHVFIDAGRGDDALEVANCWFSTFDALLGDGNDVARFTNNTFLSAHLDGGSGYDVLYAQSNSRLATDSNFEERYVSN